MKTPSHRKFGGYLSRCAKHQLSAYFLRRYCHLAVDTAAKEVKAWADAGWVIRNNHWSPWKLTPEGQNEIDRIKRKCDAAFQEVARGFQALRSMSFLPLLIRKDSDPVVEITGTAVVTFFNEELYNQILKDQSQPDREIREQ